MFTRRALTRPRAALAALAVLAFTCGALAVALRHEHARADCWREVAENGVAAAGNCR
jgi:hypothetical protein